MSLARPSDDGLLVPGRPRRRACDLTLTPAGAILSTAERTLHLPYEHYAAGDDRWTVAAWKATRGGEAIGVGILGGGGYGAPLTALSGRTRLQELLGVGGRLAPLDAARAVSNRTHADRAALDALFHTLAVRPDIRAGLADPVRTARFLGDMERVDHRPIDKPGGIRSRTVEALLVMQRRGYVHPLSGRPLPDEAPPPVDDVVEAVLAELNGNPHGLRPQEQHVRKLVRRYYSDVEPWPFAAFLPPST